MALKWQHFYWFLCIDGVNGLEVVSSGLGRDACADLCVSVQSCNFIIDAWTVLQELVGEVGGKVHTGRSRNDQVATDMKLWLRNHLSLLTPHLLHLVKV